MKTKFVIISKSNEFSFLFLEEIAHYNVEIEMVESWTAMQKLFVKAKYHGIFVDVKSKLGLSPEDKELANHIQGLYPVMYLKRKPDSTVIDTLLMGGAAEDSSVDNFIHNICANFPGRQMRICERKEIHFNVMAHPSLKLAEVHALKTVTMDVSYSGCFLMTSQPWELNSHIWLQFKEMSENDPIEGKVVHIAGWGKKMILPGLGIEFVKMSDVQQKELIRKFKIPNICEL